MLRVLYRNWFFQRVIMDIEILRPVKVSHEPGDRVHVSDAEGNWLISAGAAKTVEEKKPVKARKK